MTSSGARVGTGSLPGRAGLLAARGLLRATLAVAATMLALGFLLLFRPYASLVATAVLLGIALVVTGVLRLLRGVTAGAGTGAHRSTHVLAGILGTLAGLYCLGHVSVTVVLLSLVVGLFWVMHGLVDLVVAGGAGPGRVMTGATGVLSLLAGLTVIFWPAITLPVVAVVMGIWLTCDGVLLAVTALYLLHVARAGAAPGLLQQAEPAAPRDGVPPGPDAQLPVRGAQVGLDGVDRQEQRRGDLLVSHVRGQEAEDRALAVGQRHARLPGHAAQPGPATVEPFQHPPGEPGVAAGGWH